MILEWSETKPLITPNIDFQIVLDDKSILQHAKTTQEIKECCKDIKVLGRKDLKTLLHWLKQMKEWKASLVSFAYYFDTYVYKLTIRKHQSHAAVKFRGNLCVELITLSTFVGLGSADFVELIC